jgi:hypothetical protein
MQFLHRRLGSGVLVITLAWLGLLAGCTGKDGKTGPTGPTGSQGPQGDPGPPGTTVCMQCHTDDFSMTNYLLPIETEFADSKHGSGETFTERRAVCSGCHTTEGYQYRIANSMFPTQNFDNTSHIGCFACHAPHTNQNFDQRKTDATTFLYGGQMYDKGTSNTCAMCHQARVPSPLPASVDSSITSSRWGPHHGPQADYLAGTGAAPITGATYTSSHPHSTQIDDGCVHCHMAAGVDGQIVGDHSFEVSYLSGTSLRINSQACVECHTTWTSDTLAGNGVAAQAQAFGAAMDSIRTALIDKGWWNGDTDLVNASTSSPLSGLSADDRAALYNYQFLDPDRPSGGAHNPAYEQSVLRATVTYLYPPGKFAAR